MECASAGPKDPRWRVGLVSRRLVIIVLFRSPPRRASPRRVRVEPHQAESWSGAAETR
jgi:hypothetical protein